MFKKSIIIGDKIKAKLFVISAFYGLIPIDHWIQPYDLKLKHGQGKQLYAKSKETIDYISSNFDLILCIISKVYKETLDPILPNLKFRFISDSRGFIGLKHKLFEISRMDPLEILETLLRY